MNTNKITLYISKLNNTLYKHEFNVENIADGVCLNPIYPISRLHTNNINILVDSGAFQDRVTRITPLEAYNRQLVLINKLNLTNCIIVAYDMINNCEETIKNNIILSDLIDTKIHSPMYVLQGKTTNNIHKCLDEILDNCSNINYIAFGGMSKISISKKLQDKIYNAIPYCCEQCEINGIKHIHFLGVGSLRVITELYKLLLPYNVDISFDTSSYEQKGIFGYKLNDTTLRFDKVYIPQDKYINYDPYELAISNIKCAINYLKLLQLNNYNGDLYGKSY